MASTSTTAAKHSQAIIRKREAWLLTRPALTAMQRRRITRVAAAIPVTSDPKWWKIVDKTQPPYRRGLSKRERARIAIADLVESAEVFCVRRAALNATARTVTVAKRKALLTQLAAICDDLLADDWCRLALYQAAEREVHLDYRPEYFLQGLLAEKSAAEQKPLATIHRAKSDPEYGQPVDAAPFVKLYLLRAARPGPWARDAARNLRDCARYALRQPPLNRDTIDDTRDQLIRSLAYVWTWATGTPAVNKREKGQPMRRRGPFLDLVEQISVIVGDHVDVDTRSMMQRIRRALLRTPRPLFLSR